MASTVDENERNDHIAVALNEGATCITEGCTICCQDTEMPLSKANVERLMKLGYKEKDFVIVVEEEARLRNLNHHCFFLRDGRCIVYESRPEGCRLYPLVYDSEKRKFVLDELCPYKGRFIIGREDKAQLKTLLKRLERDALKRRKIR